MVLNLTSIFVYTRWWNGVKFVSSKQQNFVSISSECFTSSNIVKSFCLKRQHCNTSKRNVQDVHKCHSWCDSYFPPTELHSVNSSDSFSHTVKDACGSYICVKWLSLQNFTGCKRGLTNVAVSAECLRRNCRLHKRQHAQMSPLHFKVVVKRVVKGNFEAVN